MWLKRALLLISLFGLIEARTFYMDSPTACGQRISVADESITVLPRGTIVYMDSPTACGQRISVADESITVLPRGTIGVLNPTRNCIMNFESSYSSIYMDSPTACGQRISVADESITVLPRGTIGVLNPTRNCIMNLIYMDSPTACGQRISVADESITVLPRGTIGVLNPTRNCIMNFESSYSSSNYKFEIVYERFKFNDCGMSLRIFDGLSVGASYIKELGCSVGSRTGYLYSKDRAITIQLTRPVDQFNFANDFLLRITVYKDPNAPDDFIGTSDFPVGAIIGIILGIVVIIAFAILLGWCYKSGRLAGLSGDDTPITATVKDPIRTVESPGTDNGGFRSWHNTEKASNISDSRSNFLDDDQILSSLMNVSVPEKGRNVNVRNGNTRNGNYQGGRGVNQGRYEKKMERSNSTEGMRVERTASISRTPGSNSPGPKPRSRRVEPPKAPSLPNLENNKKGKQDDFDRGELGLRGSNRSMKRHGSTGDIDVENNEKRNNKSGMFENPDREGYLYDYDHVKKLAVDEKPPIKKTQDFASELQAAIQRNSMKRMSSFQPSDSNTSDAPGAPETNVKNDSDDSNSSGVFNRQTDGETTGPEGHSSPKPDRKKRNKKSPKSGRKIDNNDLHGSPKSKSRKGQDDDVPPEIYAPIFSDDDNPEYNSNQYQPGYQPAGYPVHYDPRYPMGPYPGAAIPPPYPGMPFQQAGQAQWYVENTPTGQQKMAFAMTTQSQGSQDDSMQGYHGNGPGRPNYHSTPYYNNQYGAPQGQNSRSHQPTSALVPAGTILDDPQVPPPGMTLARYDDDPITGVKTSQVIWTDSKPDPTDPPPYSEGPQITRKTITRITTRTTQDDLPDAPDPRLQDLSFKTAQQVQATGQEPAFMSPSKGQQTTYYPNAVQYVSQTPDQSNARFYTGMGRQHEHPPGSPIPVVHEAPKASSAFKDRITLKDDSQV